MRRILLILTAAAALVGCATGGAPPSPNIPTPANRVGEGSINALSTETVTLSVATVLSAPQYAGSISIIGDQLQTDGTSTAVCTAPVLLGSQSYLSSVDTLSDLTKWLTVSLSTSPPAIASGANKMLVSYPSNPYFYYRWSITCSSGAGTLTITHGKKGG